MPHTCDIFRNGYCLLFNTITRYTFDFFLWEWNKYDQNILSLSLSKWHELQLASNSIKRTLISFLFKFIIYFGINDIFFHFPWHESRKIFTLDSETLGYWSFRSKRTKHVRSLCKYTYVSGTKPEFLESSPQHPSNCATLYHFHRRHDRNSLPFGHCLRIVSIRDLIFPRPRRKRNRKVST